MSYDEAAAARIRPLLPARRTAEHKMMGALCFMVDGNMCCGVTGSALMVRVGQDGYAGALAKAHVRPMDIGGRQPKGFVLIDPEGYRTKAALEKWVTLGLATAAALPAKKPVRRAKG